MKFRAEVVQIDLDEKVAKTRDDIEIRYKVMQTLLKGPLFEKYFWEKTRKICLTIQNDKWGNESGTSVVT